MATSGSIDFSMTAANLATFALRKAGIVSIYDTPSAEDMAETIRDLNMMLKSWQRSGPNLFRQTFGSATLVAATGSYVLSPRPYKVIEARFRNASARDLPMREMTRQEYVDLPHKTSSGTPTSYYVDRQRASTTLYVWPVPASVTTETIQYTYQRVIEDIDSGSDDLDIPQEWFETVGYALAERVLDAFDKENPFIRRRAAQLYQAALDDDREAVVRFEPEMA